MSQAGPAGAPRPRIALLVLCHEAPGFVAQRLSTSFFRHPDLSVFIHYDAARSDRQLAELKALLPADGRYRFVAERVRCRWGEHTLVEATRRLLALALADEAFGATHFALLSASCVPYRPVGSLQQFLAERPGTEFIQAQDIAQGRWIQDGLERERCEYYFPFNFRTQRRWFEWLTARQREFRIRRAVPAGLKVHFGSQWFCLTRATAAHVAAQLALPAVRRWLRWSWIPDEFAIQTLVASHCPRGRIAGHNLTYYEFDAQGQPLVLDNGHHEHLLAQPFFFARKLAPEATRLAECIAEYIAQPEADLGWFARAGRATGAYSRHLAEAGTGVAQAAHLGTVAELHRGPMGTNQRRYYVLHAGSRAWLLALLQQARAGGRLPIFDLPFDPARSRLAGADGHLGLRADETLRRDHDPASFLLELVQCHPDEPAAFGLDVARASALRALVAGDPRATLIDCDPPLSREQQAATALNDLQEAADAAQVQAVLQAMRDGAPLPREAFRLGLEHGAACQHARLAELGPGLGDATLIALRAAYHALDPAPHHVAPGDAWRQFWK